MDRNQIIVCDDEQELRESLIEFLTSRGYAVRGASDGEALSRLIAARAPDLVILDVRMPKMDGLTALKAIRAKSALPVIMLSAADDTVDRILGLEFGADDYVGKPVDLRELEARVRAVLRRGHHETPDEFEEGTIGFAGFSLDISAARLLGPDGADIPLTAMEFSLLHVFVRNRGRVLNRDQLLEQAQNRGWEPFDRSIDLRISRLRRKIEPDPAQPSVIRTIRGIGYVFDPDDRLSS